MLLAGRIDVDFGEARAGIWRAAVPLEHSASAVVEGRSDVAVLRLPQPLGDTRLLSVTTPAPGGDPLGGVAMALHRLWSPTAQQGEAVALDPELLGEAIEVIRNVQSVRGARCPRVWCCCRRGPGWSPQPT